MLVSDRARSVWQRCGDGSCVNQLCAAASLLIINVLNAIECLIEVWSAKSLLRGRRATPAVKD